MSKRRITIQQQRRIHEKQNRHRGDHGSTAQSTGLVITRFGQSAEIETDDLQLIQCAIRANLNDVVTGDRVTYQLENETQGVILSVYPRKTMLARINKQQQSKPIAANLTQMCVVITESPMLSWTLLDSYLLMGMYLNLSVLIVLNKMDLVSPSLKTAIHEIYGSLGYSIVEMQQAQSQGEALLKTKLQNEVSIFVGQSGVGKSSIIRRLLPHEKNIEIGALSTHREQGQHTTSYAKYYHLPSGGAIIDSPGVREFNLMALNLRTIAEHYIEFQPLISDCKFRNCTHMNTPGCAIIQAVEKGTIMRQRYENYVKIAEMIK